jgi:hypothetical protein
MQASDASPFLIMIIMSTRDRLVKRLVSRDPIANWEASKPGEIIYVDIQTIKPTGYNGYKYFVLFLDEKRTTSGCDLSKRKATHLKLAWNLLNTSNLLLKAIPGNGIQYRRGSRVLQVQRLGKDGRDGS